MGPPRQGGPRGGRHYFAGYVFMLTQQKRHYRQLMSKTIDLDLDLNFSLVANFDLELNFDLDFGLTSNLT